MGTDGQTDRQTDMKKLILAFRNFVNAPKKFHKRRLSEAWYLIDVLLKIKEKVLRVHFEF
jgi:hypothetical protein